MFTRKALVGLVAAALSAGVMAQQSNAGKTDIFGRPYVSQGPAQVYFDSDPYAPLPQLESLYRSSVASATGTEIAADVTTDIFGRPDSGFDARQAYYDSDPFAPHPQFWKGVVSGAQPVAAETDIFGRAHSGWHPEQAYYDSDPFAPLPQFWTRRPTAGTGPVASTPAGTEAISSTPESGG